MKAGSEIALIVLACKDYESLQLTLATLSHTVVNGERIIIILNGDNGLRSAIVEYVARTWCAEQPQCRFAVKPLSAPAEPFFAIKEILEEYNLLKGVKYICKIDDDIIPLKVNWLPSLLAAYQSVSRQHRIGFVTGLINNNCWGAEELLAIFHKWEEYKDIHSYRTRTGWGCRRIIEVGEMDHQDFGTMWQHPFVARWVHQWTSLRICQFIDGTNHLTIKEIPASIYYSIGCILFEKGFWIDLCPETFNSTTDEMMIYLKCRDEQYQKWAVMDQPVIHLFYNQQRQINHDLLNEIAASLASHFHDESISTQLEALKIKFQPAIQGQMVAMQEDFLRIKERIDLLLNNVDIQ